jgi:hypothetical protein
MNDALVESPVDRDDARSRQRERTVTLPDVSHRRAVAGSSNGPFCSLTGRLVDLGCWLDEASRVPGGEG